MIVEILGDMEKVYNKNRKIGEPFSSGVLGQVFGECLIRGEASKIKYKDLFKAHSTKKKKKQIGFGR